PEPERVHDHRRSVVADAARDAEHLIRSARRRARPAGGRERDRLPGDDLRAARGRRADLRVRAAGAVGARRGPPEPHLRSPAGPAAPCAGGVRSGRQAHDPDPDVRPLAWPAQWAKAKSSNPADRQDILLFYWWPDYADPYSWFINLFHTESK